MLGFIVEGPNDREVLIQAFPKATIMVLHGTVFSKNVQRKIGNLITRCSGTFLLVDPDEAGQIIGDKIMNAFPKLNRVIVDPEQAKCLVVRRGKVRMKYGVEYCSGQYIKELVTDFMETDAYQRKIREDACNERRAEQAKRSINATGEEGSRSLPCAAKESGTLVPRGRACNRQDRYASRTEYRGIGHSDSPSLNW